MISRKMMYGMALAITLLAACGPAPVKQERVQVPVMEDSTFLTGTFFVVRHAEKNPGADSTLTEAGLKRAGKLYRMLKDSGITRIYSTPFKRALQTGDSLRILGKIDTALYKPDSTGESLLYEISRNNDWGKKILVIGHSNTIIPILKSLNTFPRDTIRDEDYDRLFMVYKGRKLTKMFRARY
ncbi:histidine phosphatase family protein [Chitinophaga niabensis]|uniref:histidine phosphatase family protein n=1 Tax=Chitinophaga niabensis TaxID=536979 RepID=UPI0031BB5A21